MDTRVSSNSLVVVLSSIQAKLLAEAGWEKRVIKMVSLLQFEGSSILLQVTALEMMTN
jgi:hypothetical protein